MKYNNIGFNEEIARLQTVEEFIEEQKHLPLSEDQLREAHGLMVQPKAAAKQEDPKAQEEKALAEQQAAEQKLADREKKRIALAAQNEKKAAPAQDAKVDAKKSS